MAPRADRPDGCHMPLCAAGAGPFGNTGKHRPGPSPDPDRAERRLNPQAPKGLVNKAPTTTLSGIADVKLKNPRGDSPVKL